MNSRLDLTIHTELTAGFTVKSQRTPSDASASDAADGGCQRRQMLLRRGDTGAADPNVTCQRRRRVRRIVGAGLAGRGEGAVRTGGQDAAGAVSSVAERRDGGQMERCQRLSEMTGSWRGHG